VIQTVGDGRQPLGPVTALSGQQGGAPFHGNGLTPSVAVWDADATLVQVVQTDLAEERHGQALGPGELLDRNREPQCRPDAANDIVTQGFSQLRPARHRFSNLESLGC
jgi:hypothetical protein